MQCRGMQRTGSAPCSRPEPVPRRAWRRAAALGAAGLVGLALAGCGGGDVAPRVLDTAAEPDPPPPHVAQGATPPRLALVLSSGGLRGLAQLGVLKVLAEEGLKPDLIVGSSVGALTGAAFAAGIDAPAWAARPLPAMLDPFGSWLVSPRQRSLAFEAFVAALVGGQRIEQLDTPFVAVATERRDGCIVLFGRGDTARAVAASSALPGALAPVGVRGRVFADGGLAAPLPVRVARALGATHVIAVDTTFHAEPVVPEGVIDSVFHAGMVMSRNLARPDRLAADVLIDPVLPPVPEVSLANRAALAAAGERAAREQIGRLRALVAGMQAGTSPPTARRPVQDWARELPLCPDGAGDRASTAARGAAAS
jgi:NTE family protein